MCGTCRCLCPAPRSATYSSLKQAWFGFLQEQGAQEARGRLRCEPGVPRGAQGGLRPTAPSPGPRNAAALTYSILS